MNFDMIILTQQLYDKIARDICWFVWKKNEKTCSLNTKQWWDNFICVLISEPQTMWYIWFMEFLTDCVYQNIFPFPIVKQQQETTKQTFLHGLYVL